MLLFGTRNPETAYPSDHRRTEPVPLPETAEEALERHLGHEMILGAITAEEALSTLAEGDHYLNGYYEGADFTTLPGPYIFH